MYSDSTAYLLLGDSVNSFSADSIAHNSDMVFATVHCVEDFTAVPFISLPQTENWVFGVLVGLFFLLILSIKLYPSLLYEEIRTVFRAKERSSIFSNPEGRDTRTRILYLAFVICVFSLYAYFFMFKYSTKDFTFLRYLYFVLVTGGFFLLKYFVIRLLCYVFFDKKVLLLTINSYFNLLIFFGIFLFPLLIFNIYAISPIADVVEIIGVTIAVVIALLVVLKLIQIFFSKLLDFFYILLYLCTLEILPILALFQVYKIIV